MPGHTYFHRVPWELQNEVGPNNPKGVRLDEFQQAVEVCTNKFRNIWIEEIKQVDRTISAIACPTTRASLKSLYQQRLGSDSLESYRNSDTMQDDASLVNLAHLRGEMLKQIKSDVDSTRGNTVFAVVGDDTAVAKDNLSVGKKRLVLENLKSHPPRSCLELSAESEKVCVVEKKKKGSIEWKVSDHLGGTQNMGQGGSTFAFSYEFKLGRIRGFRSCDPGEDGPECGINIEACSDDASGESCVVLNFGNKNEWTIRHTPKPSSGDDYLKEVNLGNFKDLGNNAIIRVLLQRAVEGKDVIVSVYSGSSLLALAHGKQTSPDGAHATTFLAEESAAVKRIKVSFSNGNEPVVQSMWAENDMRHHYVLRARCIIEDQIHTWKQYAKKRNWTGYGDASSFFARSFEAVQNPDLTWAQFQEVLANAWIVKEKENCYAQSDEALFRGKDAASLLHAHTQDELGCGNTVEEVRAKVEVRSVQHLLCGSMHNVVVFSHSSFPSEEFIISA